MGKGLLDLIIDSIIDDEWVGRRGEKLTEKELKRVGRRGFDGKILRNIYLPKENGETSEVDVVYITRKGIFVIESKNYSGWILGDEKSQKWTMSLPNGQKNQFYNPIKQNRTHVKWMRKTVGGGIPLFSIIVFSERCELKKIGVESENVWVIKRGRFSRTIRTIWDSVPDAISDERVQSMYETLGNLTNVDKATKQAHVESIDNRFRKQKTSDTNILPSEKDVEEPIEWRAQQDNESVKICPRCGSELVLRTAKKGTNAGNQFYGCSRFPKCRFIQNKDD